MTVILWILKAILVIAILGFEYLIVSYLGYKLENLYQVKKTQKLEKDLILSKYRKDLRKEVEKMRILTFTNAVYNNGEIWAYNKAIDDVIKKLF